MLTVRFLSKLHTKQRLVMLAIASLFLAIQPAIIANAHQSPGSCNSNRFTVSIVKDRTEVYQGQTLTYTVTAANVSLNADTACDITNATIDVTLPAPDGTPTGTVVNLVTGQDFLAGSSTAVIGTVPYVVNVNPGVVDIVAQVSANGTLHDAPVDHSALIIKTLGTSVASPPITPPDAPSTATPKLPNTGTAPRP